MILLALLALGLLWAIIGTLVLRDCARRRLAEGEWATTPVDALPWWSEEDDTAS